MRVRIEAENATIGVADGRIVRARGAFDVTIRVPGGTLRPGLVNAHEHLHRNHYGRLGRPPYPNAYDWGLDLHLNHRTAIARGRELPRREAMLRGAWKNLRAGVTTVVHHDAWDPAFDDGFPLRVQRVRNAHSLGFEPDMKRATLGKGPFAIHLAEGVDAGAAEEVRTLEGMGLLGPDLLAVHVVGADADGTERLRGSGAAIVWCPTSNEYLFGRTAPAALLAPGVDLLLGSDSLLTGAGSLLDELRAARAAGLVSDERLHAAVGAVAARRLGTPEPSLEVGAPADVVVLACPLLEATEADVALVMAGGALRVLHPALLPRVGAMASRGHVVTAGGVERWVSGQGSRMPAAARDLRFATSFAASRTVRA